MMTLFESIKEKCPLRPLKTRQDAEQVMQVRADWIRRHPKGNAISDWPSDERDYFLCLGAIIEEREFMNIVKPE